jgi:hypothetical protein
VPIRGLADERLLDDEITKILAASQLNQIR